MLDPPASRAVIQSLRSAAILVCAGFLAVTSVYAQESPASEPDLNATSTSPMRTMARSAIVPLAAHHQHLMSPVTLLSTTPTPALPEVALPPELDRLLQQRLEILGSPQVTDLYTEDAQIQGGRWIRGRQAIHSHWARWNRPPGSRMIPNAYHVNGSTGYIAGTHGHAENGSVQHRQNFLLALRKDGDGMWRIAAESVTDIPPLAYSAPIVAADLVAQMDDAGVERGVVLSLAYHFARSETEDDGEQARVQAENDWTSAQMAAFPDRLVGFCGVNPLRSYALRELDRCRQLPQMIGAKLHFGSDRIDLKNPAHVASLRTFFSGANERRAPLIVHMGMDMAHGREHAVTFLEELVTAAPDITIQLAHLAGGGRYDPTATDPAFAVFAAAVSAGDPRMRNLYFDTTGVLTENTSPEAAALAAQRMRQIGLQRILFGTDMAPEPTPLQAWSLFRRKMPLTDDELSVVARNVAPYLDRPLGEPNLNAGRDEPRSTQGHQTAVYCDRGGQNEEISSECLRGQSPTGTPQVSAPLIHNANAGESR